MTSRVFHDIAFIEATPRHDRNDKRALQVELTDSSVYCTQGELVPVNAG